MPLMPALEERGGQIPEFKASWDYTEKPCLKKQTTAKQKPCGRWDGTWVKCDCFITYTKAKAYTYTCTSYTCADMHMHIHKHMQT